MRCYVSCPAAIPQWQLDLVVDRLRSFDNVVSFWTRGEPYGEKEKDWITYCDAFVIILPKFAWQYTINTLSKGCKSELISAVKQNKTVYIAYVNATNNLNIYKADMCMFPGHIKAAGGTFWSLNQNYEKPTLFVEPKVNSLTAQQMIDASKVAKMHDKLEDEKVVKYCCTFEFEFHTYDRRLLLLM